MRDGLSLRNAGSMKKFLHNVIWLSLYVFVSRLVRTEDVRSTRSALTRQGRTMQSLGDFPRNTCRQLSDHCQGLRN